ncbi:Phosphoglycerate kinase [bacterium HR40]|nr:Phosphoglycerate kinase [bacterium HR40]
MARVLTLDRLDPRGKRVLVRVDFNVPMQDGEVSDATRIERGAVTLRELADKGGRVVALSHFGRPKGRREPSMSLAPIVPVLARVLGREVAFADDCIGEAAKRAVEALPVGGVALLENLRFHPGEEKNDPAFADALAALGEVYVNDAFSASHRAHASITGLAERLPAYAGRLLAAELAALEKALGGARRPSAALVGGAKVSTKLAVLENLLPRVDVLIVGGGMANTFLAAQGIDVGKSLCERELIGTARDILRRADELGRELVLPVDAVVARQFAADIDTRTCDVRDVAADEMILDVGPKSVADICRRLEGCRTLLWNGPLGAFEVRPFDRATVAVARAAADLTAAGRLETIAGGGDTVAALAHAGVLERFSYVSTAGGAFLEFIEGKVLPGIAALEKAAARIAGS